MASAQWEVLLKQFFTPVESVADGTDGGVDDCEVVLMVVITVMVMLMAVMVVTLIAVIK